jgi:ribosomal protein S18 acetylase RimI-like enzyme
MRCYAALPGGRLQDLEGLTVVSSGIDFGVFNSAMLTNLAGAREFESLVQRADMFFAEGSLRWSFWLCDDMLEKNVRRQASELFREKRLNLVAQTPGMLLETRDIATRQMPGLKIRTVADARTRFDFSQLSTAIFSLPFDIAQRIYSESPVWQQSMVGWVAYKDEQPVGIVALVYEDGVAGIYSLGTLPEHRRNGYGEAMLLHALRFAEQTGGCKYSALQATDQGMGLYRRLGYRTVTTFSVYLRQGCVAP